MSERKFEMNRDGLGILLFAVGAFFAVLLVKALFSDAPLASVGGLAVLAEIWTRSLGAMPGLVFNAGIAVIGVQLFLGGRTDGQLRNAFGLLLGAMAFSVLCGAFADGAGGLLGTWTGGAVSHGTHVVIGAIVGLFAVAASIWFVWLRDAYPLGAFVASSDREREPLYPEEDGVTPAEAAALIPEEYHRVLAEGRKQLAIKPMTTAPPASPYPEDVRRKGEIPPGARPLQTDHAPAQPESAPQASSVYRWTAPGAHRSADTPGQDLAVEAELESIPESTLESTPESTIGGESPDLDYDEVVEEDEPALTARFSVDEETAEEETREQVQPLAPLPRASWEQSSLFEEEEGDVPVDAYGTPLSLVDALRETRGEPATSDVRTEDEQASMIDERTEGPEATGETEESEEEATLEGELATREAAEIEEEEAFEDEEDEEEDEEADDDEDEDDFDEDADEESEEESEEDEDFDAASAESEEESEEVEEELAVGESEVVLSQASIDDEALVAPESARADSQQPATKSACEAATSPEIRGAPSTREREVVLQPQPAPADRTIKTPALAGDRTALLAEAGCLFLERGRVAVSMLQRQYGMDFDAACKVLDDLQEMGLLGPYLGGQRRDILLTREQWLEKVGAA